MGTAWEILRRAGVPLGTREGPPLLGDPVVLARAVEEALGLPGSERERTSLLAWLRAWSSEWPRSFATTFGAKGAALLSAAQMGNWDRGKYIKLRRLARESLADVL